MNTGTTVISYTLAAIAGVCFIQGLAILSNGGRMVDHGKGKEISYNA